MEIGISVKRADDLRAVNPETRLFEYVTLKYLVSEQAAADWAAAHGRDVEDFYLHYQEDVYVGGGPIVEGYPDGMIPGWNPDRQPSDPPASASERDHARVMAAPGTQAAGWYFANMANPDYRAFLADYAVGVMEGTVVASPPATGPTDGIMADNAIYYPAFDEAQLDRTIEFYGQPVNDDHPYPVGVEAFYTDLRAAMDARVGRESDIMPNYGHTYFLSEPDRFSQSIQLLTGWAWAEVWTTYRGTYTPTSGGNRVISYDKDYARGIADIVHQTRAGGRRVLGARDYALGLGGSDRGRLYLLALYYLVHNANTFFCYESAPTHADPADISLWQWNPAVTYDIGQPASVPPGFVDFDGRTGTTEHYELASGPDPYNPALTYHLLARRFAKGLVLVKMLPAGSVVDDRSITVHTLDQPMAPLRADGTPGQIVSEVSIRNNEGIILVTP